MPLVPQQDTPSKTVRSDTRSSPFLAHLIASATQAPQARERRRAEPAEAIAAYREVMERCAAIRAMADTPD